MATKTEMGAAPAMAAWVLAMAAEAYMWLFLTSPGSRSKELSSEWGSQSPLSSKPLLTARFYDLKFHNLPKQGLTRRLHTHKPGRRESHIQTVTHKEEQRLYKSAKNRSGLASAGSSAFLNDTIPHS